MTFSVEYLAFFEKNLVAIFLLYGFSFFYIFLSILFSFRPLRTLGLSVAFSYLMLFALAHAIVEWLDMYLQYARLVYGQETGIPISYLRLALLASSFLFLFAFGLRLNRDMVRIPAKASWLFIGFAAVLFFLFAIAYFWNDLPETRGLEIVLRNLLCFPAAIIAGMGFYKLSRKHYENILPADYRWYFRWCGYALIAYGVLAGLVTQKGQFLLSSYINNESFFAITGVPIQLFRAAAALCVAYFLIRAMALRMSQRLLGVLSTFFVMFFILASTGYVSLVLIGKSYQETTRLSAEQRDNAYLLRTFDRLYNASLNSSLSADKRAYSLVSNEYLRELNAAIGELRSMHRDEDEADAGEMETIDKITFILDRQAGWEGGLNVGDLNEIKALLVSLVELHQANIDRNKAAMAQDISSFMMLRIVLFLLSVGGFAFIGYTFQRILIKELQTLQAGAAQIAEGHLGYKIRIDSADELQELANDFNMMSDSLLDKTKRLEKEAITDGLTGLFNHKHFYCRLELEVNRAIRTNSPVSILMFDVDNFKRFNDRYGHPEGDEALRQCAAVIRESIRGVDMAARYGGEEFVVILADTDKKGAVVVAEKIRRAIEAQRFGSEEVEATRNVTVSIGVSSYPADTTELNNLIKKADDALYTAKREGKNRICAYGG